ncbi:hypothetical protein ACI2OX_03005 [Bacillus sp. N9]
MEWPSNRISFSVWDAAGKFPSAMTISSPCPISSNTFINSGEIFLGICLSMLFSFVLFLFYFNLSDKSKENKLCFDARPSKNG